MKLLIVESPTKVKTIAKFLGKEYKIISSYGHIRDLSKKNIGISITDNDVILDYVAIEKAQKAIAELKKEAKKADLILLATDNDREGEAISWHIAQILKLNPKKNQSLKIKPQNQKEYQRIVFNEISEKAIKEAIKNPLEIDISLVNAQQARRVLDRLVGFKLSPFLWKKITRGLSAGRVQSVALKIIVIREREIQAHKPEEYWKIEALLSKKDSIEFLSLLTKKNNEAISKLGIKSEKETNEILKDLETAEYKVFKIKRSETQKNAPAPFITATLQQEASQKLGYSIKQTMTVAQKLYEEGHITYHRTDSFYLSVDSLEAAKKFIIKNYGENYYNKEVKVYKKKKEAQEAHEAIRPVIIDADKVENGQALYRLIRNRFIASQMSAALFNNINIDSEATSKNKNIYTFNAKGITQKFDGFLRVYEIKEIERELPELKEGEKLKLEKLLSKQHFTEPPTRYTEASLVKELEKNGIGRPSTYAPIISTIQIRNYVLKNEEKKLKPTDIGILVSDFLEAHFKDIVDIGFTAKIEDSFDKIALKKKDWKKFIINFYNSFMKNLKQKEGEIKKEDVVNFDKIDEKCDKCGSNMIIKIGRFGKFMACSDYPNCKNTKNISGAGTKGGKSNSISIEDSAKKEETTNEICEKCKSKMIIKEGRFGKFLGCSAYPNCKNIKSILKRMDVKCPLCEKGDLIERKTKTKKTFYGCTNYPNCNFTLWDKPVNERCKKCNSLLVEKKSGTKCSNKDCKN